MKTALNHMTVPGASFAALLRLAQGLECVGIEARNDLAQPLFDGRSAQDAGRMVRDHGLRLVGLSEVYGFNRWSNKIADELRALIDVAMAAGAETINLIPLNDGSGVTTRAQLTDILGVVKPMMAGTGITALIEPLGFERASLRDKSMVAEAIDAVDGRGTFGMVHDTFHHALVGGGAVFADLTGIVHISGVTKAGIGIDQMEDADRVLVNAADRLGNIEQLRALHAAGFTGPVSYECFAPETHSLANPEEEIRASFEYISSRMEALAA